MALLAADADRMSVPDSARAVVRTILNRSSVFDLLDFKAVQGTQYQYPVEATRPTSGFVGVNATLSEDAPTVTQTTVTLKIVAVQSDIDKFLLTTKSNIIDQMSAVRDSQAMSIRDHWLDRFYYGSATTFSDEFSGLHVLMDDTNQSINEGGALALSNMTQIIHQKAKLGVDVILLNSEIMTRLSNSYQILGNSNWRLGPDDFGRSASTFNGIPLIVDDNISMVETNGDPPTKTGSNTSSIFFIRTGAVEQGLMQALIGEELFRVSAYDLHNKNAIRSRVVAYSAIVAPRYSVSRIRGITDAAVTA